MSKSAVSSYVQGYERYLLLEEGLSAHTRKAYREDLQRFLDYAAARGLDVLCARLSDSMILCMSSMPPACRRVP